MSATLQRKLRRLRPPFGASASLVDRPLTSQVALVSLLTQKVQGNPTVIDFSAHGEGGKGGDWDFLVQVSTVLSRRAHKIFVRGRRETLLPERQRERAPFDRETLD